MGLWVAALVAITLLAPSPAGASRAGELILEAEETVLRLHDLPSGYEIGYDDGCEMFKPSDLEKLQALDRWVVKYQPAWCKFPYERRFRAPSTAPTPPDLTAETISVPSVKGAADGLAIFHRLLQRFGRWQSEGAISIGAGGPVASLYHLNAKGRQSSLVLWQNNKLLSAIEVSGDVAESSDEVALYYAEIQQRRIESPSPYTEAERDDTEVELDDPNLKLPVYWLGHTFEPGNGLPSTELQTATVSEEQGLPGSKVELRYDGFNLETWTRRGWKLVQDSVFRKLNHPRCTRTYAFKWERGHAIISAGYRRRTFDAGCPDFPPNRFWAAAHISGVVIGVNQTTCRCLSPGFGPYSESLQGMKAILRGLTLRPKPNYSAAL